MPFSLTGLRRWFAVAAILAVAAVAGVYFYGRHRVQNALKQVPEKIGLEIKQSATGFTVSKSEQGRTLFKIEASKAVQFQQGGRAELHDVAITLYGRDSGRYDRIYGSDFLYNQQTGDVTAKGEVQIDLEANPEGLLNPDQSPPKELKNPIHLKTSGLVFNQKTGDAHTAERVEFRLPQAEGSAVGVTYIAQTNLLTLESEVKIVSNDAAKTTLTAARGAITKDPHRILLSSRSCRPIRGYIEPDRAALFLRDDNTINRILASGNVVVHTDGPPSHETHADQLDILMAKDSDDPRLVVFSGSVSVVASACNRSRPMPAASPSLSSANRGSAKFTRKRM